MKTTKLLSKSTNFIAILATLGLIFGCSEEFLDTSPQGTLFTSGFFQTEEEVEQSLFGAYDVLGHQKGQKGDAFPLPWAPYLIITEILSDDAYAGGQDAGDGADENEFNTFNISSGNELVRSIWTRNYFGIYRANFTIQVAEELENTTEEFRNQIIAEAKFLRAFFYFEQVKFFENIPLILTVVSPSEANQPQVEPSEVYNQIATDLVDAIEFLPEDYGSSRGRATKWAAQALLARVFLFEDGVYGTGMTANGTAITSTYVLDELEEMIIANAHSLEPEYGDIFQMNAEFGPESVFEVVYDGTPVGGDWGTEHRIEGNLAAQMMGPRITGSAIFYRGWSFGIPSHKLFLDMAGDPRLPHTIFTEADLLAENNTSLNTGAFQHTGYYNAKYTTRLSDRGAQGTPELHNMTNYRAIRYADVLLMAAELGQNVDYLNQVRARVQLPPLGAYSDDALFEERRMELSMEGIRYFDLLRRGLNVAEQELTLINVIGPNYTGEDALYDVVFNPATRGFLPIPQIEIDLSNGVLKQNQGY